MRESIKNKAILGYKKGNHKEQTQFWDTKKGNHKEQTQMHDLLHNNAPPKYFHGTVVDEMGLRVRWQCGAPFQHDVRHVQARQ